VFLADSIDAPTVLDSFADDDRVTLPAAPPPSPGSTCARAAALAGVIASASVVAVNSIVIICPSSSEWPVR